MDKWTKMWETYIKKQTNLSVVYLHSLLGCLLKKSYFIFSGNQKQDLRISALVVSDTGTGKTEANNFIITLGKKLGLNIISTVDLTDASLIGSFDYKSYEYNINHNLTAEKSGYKNPIKFGLLYSKDLIIFDEAEDVLRPSRLNEKIQRIIQGACNRYYSETNKQVVGRALESFEYQTSSSFILTTYKLPEIRKTLLERGLLQRMLFLIIEVTIEDKVSIFKSLFNGSLLDFKEQQQFIKDLELLREKYKEPIEFKFSNESIYLINQIADAYFFKKDFENDEIQKNYEGIVIRLLNILKIISCHYSALNLREIVIEEDIKNAKKVTDLSLSSSINFLEAQPYIRTPKETYKTILENILVRGRITSTELYKEFSKISKIGMNKSIRIVKEFSDVLDFTEGEGKKIYISLKAVKELIKNDKPTT